jgi:hypothetical protein
VSSYQCDLICLGFDSVCTQAVQQGASVRTSGTAYVGDDGSTYAEDFTRVEFAPPAGAGALFTNPLKSETLNPKSVKSKP